MTVFHDYKPYQFYRECPRDHQTCARTICLNVTADQVDYCPGKEADEAAAAAKRASVMGAPPPPPYDPGYC